MAEPLLQLAEELERRDERAAGELAAVEAAAQEVEQLRDAAAEGARFLAALPAELSAAGEELDAAGAGRDAAAESVAEAEERVARAEDRGSEQEQLAAARAAQRARERLAEADARLVRARGARLELDRAGEERRREAAELERAAGAVSERLAALPRVAGEAGGAPEPGLDGVLAWASRARGGLLVATTAIVAERERVAREATELVASISGEPLALSGAAGVRERVARTLAQR